jgi:hypothetical protein
MGIVFGLLYDVVVGLVPRVLVRRGLRRVECAVVITETRSICVLEPGRKAEVERVDPDVMATDPKNFVVKHEWLEKVELRKSFFGGRYELRLEYSLGSGGRKRLRAQLVAPIESSGQSNGQPGGDAGLDYARRVRALYQRAFSASFSDELLEWNV